MHNQRCFISVGTLKHNASTIDWCSIRRQNIADKLSDTVKEWFQDELE